MNLPKRSLKGESFLPADEGQTANFTLLLLHWSNALPLPFALREMSRLDDGNDMRVFAQISRAHALDVFQRDGFELRVFPIAVVKP